MSAPKFKTLDVRALLAKEIEPYPEIRRRVNALTPGNSLIVIAPFLPAPLIEKLKSEGFSSSVKHQTDGAWATQFWRE